MGALPAHSGARRVTIGDLAAHLALTKGTVSRALNDYPDIAEATRLRVRKAAADLGYRPLSHAQAIRTGRVRAIGLVLQVSEHDGHAPFLADFLAGLSQRASAEGWTLTVATAASQADALGLLARLADERKADGYILPRTLLADPRIAVLRAREIPFVLYGRTGDPEGCAWHDIESEAAMADAVSVLTGLGHRRIGFVGGGEGYTYARLRADGFVRAMRQAGLATDLLAGPAVEAGAGASAAARLLDRDDPPTALVYAVDHAALGAYATAAARGLKIGRDLSILSYDGIPEGAFVSPPLSTFAVDTRAAGARLAELLIRRIRGEAPEALRELARARFVPRGSHGTAPPTTTTNREERP